MIKNNFSTDIDSPKVYRLFVKSVMDKAIPLDDSLTVLELADLCKLVARLEQKDLAVGEVIPLGKILLKVERINS